MIFSTFHFFKALLRGKEECDYDKWNIPAINLGSCREMTDTFRPESRFAPIPVRLGSFRPQVINRALKK
jgi:hypothetical protein